MSEDFPQGPLPKRRRNVHEEKRGVAKKGRNDERPFDHGGVSSLRGERRGTEKGGVNRKKRR